MIKCPFCGTMNVPNTLYCSECGTYLLEDDRRATDLIDAEAEDWTSEGEAESETESLPKRTGPLALRLKIGDSQREIEVNLTKPAYLGRLDPSSDVFPDVDLTSDDGLEHGVSRRHARILNREGSVVVEDLGSINGTFVNGKRLAPYLPGVLHHGDRIQIGQLIITVEFR
jgi:hypothetical protein